MTVAKIDNHADAAVERLSEQYRSKATLAGLLRVFAAPAQALEDAAHQVLVQRSIDNAVGVQLDALGAVVGRDRAGLVDDVYRAVIRAQISANKSSGTHEELLTIARLVLNDESLNPTLDDTVVMVGVLDVNGYTVVGEQLADLIRLAKPITVQMIVQFLNSPPAEAFTFAEQFTTLLTARGTGAYTSFVADDPIGAGFDPSGGVVTLSAGTTIEETFTYDSIAGNTFNGSFVGATGVHAVGASVSTQDAAKGYSDTAAPTTGGKFASAVKA